MNKDLISKDYLIKIKLLKKYNKYYYDKDKPIITDQKYDYLKNEILNLEKKNEFLKNKHSPSQTIGYNPSRNSAWILF